MLVKVALLCDEDGKPMPRHREVTTVPTILGRLEYRERFEKDFRRHVYSARLRGLDGGDDVVPQLWDAVLHFAEGEFMTMSGIAEQAVTHKRAPQSWYIEVVAPR